MVVLFYCMFHRSFYRILTTSSSHSMLQLSILRFLVIAKELDDGDWNPTAALLSIHSRASADRSTVPSTVRAGSFYCHCSFYSSLAVEGRYNVQQSEPLEWIVECLLAIELALKWTV